MGVWRTVGCNGVISGGLEIQGLGKGPPGVLTGWTALFNWEDSPKPVFLNGHAAPLPHLHAPKSWLGGHAGIRT